jgi:hypothetical protein
MNYEMHLGISLNFEVNSVDGEYYTRLFNEYVHFQPDIILFKKSGSGWKENRWNTKKHLKLISELDGQSNFNISDNENVFICNQTASGNPHRSIRIVGNQLTTDINLIDLFGFINRKGFVSGYLYNEVYEKIQSTEFANNIRRLNVPAKILSTIKNTPYRIEYSTGFKIYDIKYNPGRSELIGYTWLMPAWKMWFGNGFYHLVPKERILTFPDAFEIKELDNDIVYVHLFETIEESWTEKSMRKQQAWREWLDFNKLVEQYP